eukprot:g16514.t1
MGEEPKNTEIKGLAEFAELVSDRFEARAGHELKADTFISLKETGQKSPKEKRWMAVQLKICSKRTRPWARKMKWLLRHQKDALRNVLLVAYSLDPSDPVFLHTHTVHRHQDYASFAVCDKHHNCLREHLSAQLLQLWESDGAATFFGNPSQRFVYSQATKTEAEVRSLFLNLLEDSDLRYDPPTAEYDTVDGILSTIGPRPVSVRVQEKVFCIRQERGENLGLRVSLRRPPLLRIRLIQEIAGSLFVSFRELAKAGYLRSDACGGCSILAVYPDAPGVKTPRVGGNGMEKYFFQREELTQAIENELKKTHSDRIGRHG